MRELIGYLLLGICCTIISPYKRESEYYGVGLFFFLVFEISLWCSVLFTLRKGVLLAWGI
jgi:hypothetical protein